MAHWRNTARTARFFVWDARVALALVLFLMHMRWWTFSLLLASLCLVIVLEYFDITLPVLVRRIQSFIAGRRRVAVPWWRR